MCGLEVFCLSLSLSLPPSLSLSLERRRVESAKLYTRWSGAALLRYLYRAPTIRPALILILAFSYARVSVFLQEDERAKGKEGTVRESWKKTMRSDSEKKTDVSATESIYRFTAIMYMRVIYVHWRYITLNIFHTSWRFDQWLNCLFSSFVS